MTTIKQISSTFSDLVLDQVGEHIDAIVERNKDGDDGTCATHDFCDANMLMAEAFEEVEGREPDVTDEHDATICNAAWDLSVQREFK